MHNVSPPTAATEVAVLGGGCFWCLDAVYRGLKGVVSVESGYAGGAGANPSYEEICTGRTGHAEVVQDHLRSRRAVVPRFADRLFHDPRPDHA